MKKEEILANCIEEIRSGKSTVEDCVKRYPHLGNELRSLLEIAVSLKPDEVSPSPEFKERAKMHLFGEVQPEPMKVSQSVWKWYRTSPYRILAPVSIAVLILVVAGGSTVYASQSSLPGDTLYPVKTTVENLQLAITTSPAVKADLYLKFTQRRIDEVQQEVKLNRNVSAQTLATFQQQFDDTLKELGNSNNTKTSNATLSRLSVVTLNQQVELEQTLAGAPLQSQPVIQQILDETRRGNTIAQVAYSNHDFLQQKPSVADKKLDSGQFSIEGTLISIDGKTWNVGGTIIENVHLSGKTPAVGSRVSLQGLVKYNNTFISKIEVSENSTEPTKVEGQFGGTNQNGTADISGIPVKISNNSSAQLNPGDNVQLQSGKDDGKLDVTSKNTNANQSITIEGVLTAVDVSKGTITVKMTGSAITINISHAKIESKNNDHRTYQISDLSRSIGRDINLESLTKQGNLLYADTVIIDAGH
jgi:ribosomal protein L24